MMDENKNVRSEEMKAKEERIKSTIRKIIDLFSTGDVPKAIAIATYPPFDVPSNLWSYTNRILMMISGTSDARGFRAWEQAGRYVRKGQKALYILAPRLIRKKQKDEKPDDKKNYICTGFLTVPVFAVEQTEGEKLDYEKLELPDLPLMEKAQEWGIDVKPIAFQGGYMGQYRIGENEEIRLATPNEKTFFHELSHAAHKRVKGYLANGQNPKQEIVAELSAQVLAQLVGTKTESTLGNTYKYIEGYAKQDAGKACLAVISDVEKVLKLILS